MKKFKRGRRALHQIGRWVKCWQGNTYTPIGYGKPIPGPYRKRMGGSQPAAVERLR